MLRILRQSHLAAIGAFQSAVCATNRQFPKSARQASPEKPLGRWPAVYWRGWIGEMHMSWGASQLPQLIDMRQGVRPVLQGAGS
ncbi:hypothetical protein PTKU15_87830 [Paraburkholderia terrae]|nr:hypothetical protein PTKU15_87830 [Paraburkholderia terrae]